MRRIKNMSEDFSVRVDGIRFASAHFATFRGRCEPLHGHSYEVEAQVDGSLTEDSWVIDFRELKALLRKASAEIDHKFILQRNSRLLQVEELAAGWRVRTPAGLEYVFPAEDVAALPIENSTAERLAEWFCRRLWTSLKRHGQSEVRAVVVEVWEGPGQKAAFRLTSKP
jgi:6-pyruvoyltetrahydropterin/6-carboxytetrahydropterin synthase